MLTRFQLLENIGVFQTASSPAASPLLRYVLLYAENGRGKTTLSAIFHSLASGNPTSINERGRLGSPDTPHVVVASSAGPPPFVFQNGAWNRLLPELIIFDDQFVNDNVYSGLAVEPGHRQKLHELVIGSDGISLNRQLQDYVRRIEVHNTELRERQNAITARELGGYDIDVFCDLPVESDVGTRIRDAEQSLAAALDQARIRANPAFSAIEFPDFDTEAIAEALRRTLDTLDSAAAAHVQAHIQSLGKGSETWVQDGMNRIIRSESEDFCPFCVQQLGGSPIISQYRAYFGREYASLKEGVSAVLRRLTEQHSADHPARLERAVSRATQVRTFWAMFSEMPIITLDTETFIRDWQASRDGLVGLLEAKGAAPLESLELSDEVLGAIGRFRAGREELRQVSERLVGSNPAIEALKVQAAAGDPQLLRQQLDRLLACQRRHSPRVAPLCDQYQAEKTAKAATERLRDQTREQIDRHRATAFPRYQEGINRYLERFGVGFRIARVAPADTRGGATCNYDVVINKVSIPIGAGVARPAQPSFRNILSAGDRNALALAFFFTSLEAEANLGRRIVVLDDPLSSLDEHRSFATVQEVRKLGGRVAQLILLSHDKSFLGRVWEGVGRDSSICRPLKIRRAGQASVIEDWEISADSVTEHDRNHSLLRDYLRNGPGADSRAVAVALRPVLEGFVRVVFPEHCPPRPRAFSEFMGVCRQRVNTATEILNAQDLAELSELVDYGNLFHHETNAAWEDVVINDAELHAYVGRVLGFASLYVEGGWGS
jgi:wobble nucleotide-excising tRNase